MLPYSYNLRNLQVRRLRTLLNLAGIALVIAVFCYLLCFAQGLRRALALTGDPYNMLVLAEAATAESNSALSNEQVRTLAGVPQVAVGVNGRPLVSPEVITQTNVIRRGDESGIYASVAVRGLYPDIGLEIHPTSGVPSRHDRLARLGLSCRMGTPYQTI